MEALAITQSTLFHHMKNSCAGYVWRRYSPLWRRLEFACISVMILEDVEEPILPQPDDCWLHSVNGWEKQTWRKRHKNTSPGLYQIQSGGSNAPQSPKVPHMGTTVAHMRDFTHALTAAWGRSSVIATDSQAVSLSEFLKIGQVIIEKFEFKVFM